MDASGSGIVGYLGFATELSIGNDIDELCAGCFAQQTHLSAVSFEADSRVRRIGDHAFDGSRALRSIVIPSTVEMLGESCFSGCTRLSTVSFEPNSRLSAIGRWAFDGCSTLTTVWVPSHIRSILELCFPVVVFYGSNHRVKILTIGTDSVVP
jgi:hypothetical protein